MAGNQVKLPNVSGTAIHSASYDHLNRLHYVGGNKAFEYDALGRRIVFEDYGLSRIRWYYHDGVNEILETSEDGETLLRWFVHGVSYIDERLMMFAERDYLGDERIETPFYYAIDRMYNVRYLLDRTGAIVESYVYDPYGKPLIRECAGRGDMTGNSVVDETGNNTMFTRSDNCETFDPRADMDDDGDVDDDDESLFYAKAAIWDGSGPADVKLARSLVGNPYMFQGRPNFIFATDMTGDATNAELMLNDHRNRFADPMTGRWLTRDPIGYESGSMSLFECMLSSPNRWGEMHSGCSQHLNPRRQVNPVHQRSRIFGLQ